MLTIYNAYYTPLYAQSFNEEMHQISHDEWYISWNMQ